MRRPFRLLLCLPLLLAACEERASVSVYETTPVAAYVWPTTESREGAAEGMVWEVPAGFVTQEDVPDALAGDYRYPGQTQSLPGRLTVSMLPGDGGIEANVSRWADQFLVVVPQDLSRVVTVSPALPHPWGTVWIVQVRGHYAGPTMPTTMLAAVVTVQDREGRAYATWFLKLTGDEPTVERGAEALTRVVYSLRPEGTAMPELDAALDPSRDPHEGVPGAPPLTPGDGDSAGDGANGRQGAGTDDNAAGGTGQGADDSPAPAGEGEASP